ncbi:MATE family efflux transporter [Novosphingobium piscinae]|uniref:Multidrug-efflux transporter n=1 Tax=Novosphingobium piscinae TaxID=1507448 RepID=A0A7X1G0C5_9SPHN|nr:MATE family efflux transporter [Novosphingobium piscinae]MBC2670231.1 MATE family efflux transporter [Novosphingobium piscinae]
MARSAPSRARRAEFAATLRLAGPLAAANVLQMLVYAIDVVFVARLGSEPLAAASLSTALFGLIAWSFSGLTGAVAPLISAELGRRRHAVREIRRSVRMALWLAMACAAVGMLVCAGGERLMLATGQAPRVSAQAGAFLAVLMLALPPIIAGNVLRTFVSAMGRPYFATAITALAIAVNTLGNLLFVFGYGGAPALGLVGSAVSSVLTAVVTLLAYVVAIRRDRRLRRYHLFGRLWRAEWSRLAELLRIGLPIAATILAEAGLFSGAAFLMGRIGEAQLAGHTVALQVAAFCFQIPFGVGQAATIRVGYHFGAGDRAGVARAGWAALAIGVGVMACTAGTMLLVPRSLVALYVDLADPANAAMIGFATQFMLVAAAFQLFDGIQAVAAGVLRGLQNTSVPMVIALFAYWVPGAAAAIGLGLFTPLAGLGVWLGLLISLVVAATLLLWRWAARERLGLVPA